MAYNLIKAMGITISQESSTPGTYTEIEGVKEISGFNFSASDVDVTPLSASVRVFKGGVVDAGETSVTIFFDPDNTLHAALRAQSLAPVSKNMKLVLTDATPVSYTWEAYVKGFELSQMAIDGYLEAVITFKNSGTVAVA